MTSDGRWNYTWDAEKRLIKVESRSDTPSSSWRRIEWTYDVLGRSIQQVTSIWTNNAWLVVENLKFVSDPMLFGRHIVELNATNNALVRSYAWGLDLSGSLDGAGGVGGLTWVTLHTASGSASGTQFVCNDGNGNIIALVSATTGDVTASYEYGPFGEPIRISGPAAALNPFRFSTKRIDNTTDFVIYEYRVYSPCTGRWLSRDPIEERGGRNLYGFVGNKPISEFDLNGQWYPGFPGKPEIPPMPPIDCSGYSKLGGASCKDCGKVKQDNYPQQAQSFCEGFKKLYTGSPAQGNAACVASCLVNAEKGCQSKYQDCDRRSCCRLLAHVKCYSQCTFIPFEGMPPGAWDFGWSRLIPSCKSLLSEMPVLPPGQHPSY